MGRNQPVAVNETPVPLAEALTSPSPTDNDRLETTDYNLAEIHFSNGLEVRFTFDELSGDFGFGQRARIGQSPLFAGDFKNLLEVYLAITPGDLPVPEELLLEGEESRDLKALLEDRRIATGCVVASQLDLKIPENPSPREGQSCLSQFFPWDHWFDPAQVGLAPKCYYASSFGGKARYSQSYIFNCVPAGSPSYLWARHRIYYKNIFGNYVKQYDAQVAPGDCDVITKGSIRRWRRVCYDDGWNSSPNNPSLKYTRQGRFTD